VYTNGRVVQRAVADEMEGSVERIRLEAVSKSGLSAQAWDRVVWMLRAGEAVAARRLEYSGEWASSERSVSEGSAPCAACCVLRAATATLRKAARFSRRARMPCA
jgi:hypothetical protein